MKYYKYEITLGDSLFCRQDVIANNEEAAESYVRFILGLTKIYKSKLIENRNVRHSDNYTPKVK